MSPVNALKFVYSIHDPQCILKAFIQNTVSSDIFIKAKVRMACLRVQPTFENYMFPGFLLLVSKF